MHPERDGEWRRWTLRARELPDRRRSARSVGSPLGRDPSPRQWIPIKTVWTMRRGLGRRVFRESRSAVSQQRGDAATRALSRSPGRNLARGPRWYTARSAISRGGSPATHVHRRTSPASRRKRPPPRDSIRIRVRALPCIRSIAPRYICHLASPLLPRNEDRPIVERAGWCPPLPLMDPFPSVPSPLPNETLSRSSVRSARWLYV